MRLSYAGCLVFAGCSSDQAQKKLSHMRNVTVVKIKINDTASIEEAYKQIQGLQEDGE